jgi:hypothetical protein
MPDVGRSSLYQVAVVWEAGAPDAFGQPTVGAPCQVRCRWERTKREKPRPDGTVLTLDSMVFTTRFVKPYSWMWQGALRDLPAGTDFSTTMPELYRVVSCDGIPDLRNRITEYEVSLQRASDTLPTRST